MGGGGMILRSVGRVSGAGIAGSVASSAIPQSSGIVKLQSSASSVAANAGKAAAASSSVSFSASPESALREVATLESAGFPAPASEDPARSSWELDDWEFTAGAEEIEHELPVAGAAAVSGKSGSDSLLVREEFEDVPVHVVFSSVPSKSEVEQAIQELQRTDFRTFNLSGSKASSYGSIASDANSAPVLLEGNKKLNESPTSLESVSSRNGWIEPHLHSSNSDDLQITESNDVMRAFKLLRTNSDVQEMVASLACDKAIWDAVMKNEKVAEFQRQLEKDNLVPHGSADSSEDESGTGKNWWHSLKDKMFKYMDKIKEIVQEMFGFSENKSSGSSDGHNFIASSVMLSVVVLLVVLLKRV